MPFRPRAVVVGVALLATLLLPSLSATPVRAADQKVAIIVGPVGALTDTYRAAADRVAEAAVAAGAAVAKAYSPYATWPRVKSAVEDANIIVYFGHGNGFPNPYSTAENTDRVNGWGLNRDTMHGDDDNWSTTMAYCGERALLGTLTAGDDTIRTRYCGGTANDGLQPAPGFTMVYAQAHYAPGFGERYSESDPKPTLTEGQQRVRNYSYPVLRLGARGYFATAYGDADDIVRRVLEQPTTAYGDLFRAGEGYVEAALRVMPHPDIPGAEVWVQKSSQGPSMHFGDPDYWYAFAGDPAQSPAGTGGLPFADISGSAFVSEIIWLADSGITRGCTSTLFCPRDPVTRGQMASFLARALQLPAASTDWFTDDDGLSHEDNINRLAEAGITTGCSETTFCPHDPVTRGEMASFLARALQLPEATADWFTDDDGVSHEDNINRLAEAGITSGCAATRFCPAGIVIRQQMAAFLERALGS